MIDPIGTEPERFQPTRRKFISSAASAAFGFTLVPRHVLGGLGYIAPSEQLQVAGIGAGGMGGGDIATVSKLGANFVRYVMWMTRERLVPSTLIRKHGDIKIFAKCSTKKPTTSTP